MGRGVRVTVSSELVLRVAGTPVVQAEEGDAAGYNVDTNAKGRCRS